MWQRVRTSDTNSRQVRALSLHSSSWSLLEPIWTRTEVMFTEGILTSFLFVVFAWFE